MNWALITQTLKGLETLSAEDLAKELSRLNSEDAVLASAVAQLHGNRKNAASFMQTHMPGSQQRDGATLELGARIGIWQIEALLGAGGMGEVYRATRADGLFDQQVALKISRRMGDEFAARFEAERQRLAQLEHPNIARIVDGGTTEDGSPYMTMEFVEGHAIDQHVGRNLLDRSGRLGLIVRLCTAVAHAHGRLVLHRDIKHDNVLINLDGELRLIDFGVASLIGDVAEQGGFSSLTPAYAAPEQLTGNAVSAATDTFAIGMLAHLLETGALPKRQPDGGVMIDSAAIKDADLAAILAKATADDPADRYGSVDALGDDLGRFLDGFPVAARPVSSVTKFKKMVARNKFASAMSALAVVAMIAGVIGASVFGLRANKEAEAARIAQRQGGNTVELYETYNSGFNAFVSSIDPQSPQGQSVFSALEALEVTAQETEKSNPQRSLEINVFLAELYADIGRDEDASRVGQSLGQSPIELTYPVAFTLSGLVNLSRGFVEDDELVKTLDRLNGFFSKDPKIHSFDIAMNRCVRQRITNKDQDAQNCLSSATKHLQKIDMDNYAEASGNLVLFAYSADSAIRLKQFDRATQAANSGIEFYQNETRPGSVPEASFWALRSDIAQAQKNWIASKQDLLSARKALESDLQIPWMEVDVSIQMAETQIALREFTSAEASARLARDQALELYGADHYQVREAAAYIAVALAGNGDKATAKKMLEEILVAEAESMNDPKAKQRYTQMLAQISAM